MITLLGWLGAFVALVAYAQTGTARFRQIALLSSVVLLTFNVLLGIWSNVVLESSLAAVNLSRLVQLRVSNKANPRAADDQRRDRRPFPGAGVECFQPPRVDTRHSTSPVWSVSGHPG